MMEWMRDDLWPTMHPESINYEFMQEPLMSGEVWVAFDHTARLIDAFESDPDQFIGFPAPAGPKGRGFMPVILGLGIPADAPNPEAGAAVIEYLTRPDVQGEVLSQLGFYPVVAGVDFGDLPAGVQIEADTVTAQANSPDALPALLPVGLGDRGGEINQTAPASLHQQVQLQLVLPRWQLRAPPHSTPRSFRCSSLRLKKPRSSAAFSTAST